MGCGASTNREEASQAGDGKVLPFSSASLALCAVKPDGKTSFEQRSNSNKRGTSNSLNEKWSLSKSSPFSIRFWTSSGFPEVREMLPASNASISVGDADNLTLLLGSYYPLEMPVAKHKSSLGSVAVICPLVKAVDLYVTVDGEAKPDGHICCGDGTYNRDASIKHAEAKVASYGEEAALRSMLEAGPPGSAQPWATVVSKELSNEFFVLLPLIVQGNIDDSNLPESEEYGGALVGKFASLLSAIGPGSHEVTVRIAPRGVIRGGAVCSGAGGWKGGGTDGIGLGMDNYYDGDANFKALIDGPLAGQHVAADVGGLSASSTLTVPPKLCQGGGGERKAPAWGPFSADIVEHCNIACAIAASGPPRAAVSSLLGSSIGSPAHIIIPESDLAGGITPMNGQGGREAGTRFFTTAFFFSANADDDDSLGAMVKFVCAKYERRHHKGVSNPKWESEGTFGNSREKCSAFPIKNGQIRAAIERDAAVYAVDKNGGGGGVAAMATGSAGVAASSQAGYDDKEEEEEAADGDGDRDDDADNDADDAADDDADDADDA